MMDIEKLIEGLQSRARFKKSFIASGENWTGGMIRDELCADAATALSALQAENEKLRDELRQSWTSVNNNLPAPEEEVELFCQTQWGTYTCHGFYVPDNFSEEDSDYCWDFENMSSYDEENDCYYIAPGWYERIHNWDDYGAVGINDKVTHWRPLSFPDFSKED